MDNKIFNVNGTTKIKLLHTIRTIMLSDYAEEENFSKAESWVVDPIHGLVINWYNKPEFNSFLTPQTPEQITEQVWQWLQTEEADNIKPVDRWDVNMNHDGHNSTGWRVYVGDWGHVGGNQYAIFAVRKIYAWHGK